MKKPILIACIILAFVSSSATGDMSGLNLSHGTEMMPAQQADVNKKLDGLDRFITSVMKDWQVPGLSVCVVKNDSTVYLKGFGYRDINKKLPATPYTLFPIASCTKAFTATGLGILSAEKRFNWDNPVTKYLPDFCLKDEYATAHITTRDLVSHRSGLARHDYMWWHTVLTRKDIYLGLRHLDFNREFRESYQYNNLMFMTSGIIIERITGMSWEHYIRKNILDPLDMYATNFTIAGMENSGNYAKPYKNINGEIRETFYCDMTPLGPAGSINSNANEMANWLIMNLNNGRYKNRQVIPGKELAEILAPQTVTARTIHEEEMTYKLYAMGWGIITYRGHLMAIHLGGIDGSRSLVAFLPKEKTGVVVLTNIEYSPIREIIAYNIFDRMLEEEPVDWNKRYLERMAKDKSDRSSDKPATGDRASLPPSLTQTEYTGLYTHPAYGKISVQLRDDRLMLTFNNITTPLNNNGRDSFTAEKTFYFGDLKFNFRRGERGDVYCIEVALEPSVKDIVFTRSEE